VIARLKAGDARGPITVCIMLATLMNSLDTTIANVALPHMAGELSASQDQMTWVLTSYIVSAAIMTPVTGWLADRIGRKMLFMVSIFGFTVASMLCGAATSLPAIVIFRLMQGVCGAALIPLSQAVLLDINPPEKHGQAMAVWGAGALVGPILGPALGGWLTDNLNWRWVFYINLPVGILAFVGVWMFLGTRTFRPKKPFDFFGFGTLAVFIGTFQLLLDRGPTVDWFGSAEIWTYAILGGLSLYLFIVHSLTAEHPFFDRALITDRNFGPACVIGFFLGTLLYGTLSLLPQMLETLFDYPVQTTGLVTMPRGLGSFFAMFFVGRLVGKVDTRLILAVGIVLSAVSTWQMSHFAPNMSAAPVIFSGLVQGVGTGLIFVPLSAIAFSTLDAKFRGEAAAVYTLIRNMGASAGISVLEYLFTRNIEVVRSGLTGQLRPDNPNAHFWLRPSDFGTPGGLAALDGAVNRQAAMVAYVDDFHLMLMMSFLILPLLLLMQGRRKTAVPAASAPDLEAQGAH
jgi:DHA2 family multidrug resistance protein